MKKVYNKYFANTKWSKQQCTHSYANNIWLIMTSFELTNFQSYYNFSAMLKIIGFVSWMLPLISFGQDWTRQNLTGLVFHLYIWALKLFVTLVSLCSIYLECHNYFAYGPTQADWINPVFVSFRLVYYKVCSSWTKTGIKIFFFANYKAKWC